MDSESRTLGKHILALLFLALISGLAAREAFLFLRAQMTLGHNIWSTRRASEMTNAIDRLDPDLNSRRILFLGSSDTLLGVRARDIEERLNRGNKGARWEVLNLAFLGLDSVATRLLIRRYLETPSGRTGGLHSVFIGFQPTFYTRRFRQLRQRGSAAFAFETEFYSEKMLRQELRVNPTAAVQIWNTAYLFDGISPGEARRHFASLIERGGRRTDRGIDRVWDFDGPGLQGFDWKRRGHFYFDAPGVNPESARKAVDFSGLKEAWRRQVTRAYDGLELNLDEGLLSALEANIQLLKTMSKRVVLFEPAPCDELGVSAEGRARADAALARIGKATGTTTAVMPGFNCADYFDMLHLNPQGQEKLTAGLVEMIEGLKE